MSRDGGHVNGARDQREPPGKDMGLHAPTRALGQGDHRTRAPAILTIPARAMTTPAILKTSPHVLSHALLASGFFETRALSKPTKRHHTPMITKKTPSIIHAPLWQTRRLGAT